tara:strand:+ start:261 stop:455 length:195 start_codon:yes stop_codon:yes gene_type:complete
LNHLFEAQNKDSSDSIVSIDQFFYIFEEFQISTNLDVANGKARFKIQIIRLRQPGLFRPALDKS